MTPEDRDALIEAGYDPDDPDVQDRMLQVERGLTLLRARWHTRPSPGQRRITGHGAKPRAAHDGAGSSDALAAVRSKLIPLRHAALVIPSPGGRDDYTGPPEGHQPCRRDTRVSGNSPICPGSWVPESSQELLRERLRRAATPLALTYRRTATTAYPPKVRPILGDP